MHSKNQQPEWVYSNTIEHDDGDVRKLDHTATNTVTGETRDLDYTPYEEMSEPVFRAFVALGFPQRLGRGPWYGSDVLAAHADREVAA